MVKWEGYADSDNTWEYVENILSPELIKEYEINATASSAEPVKTVGTHRQKEHSVRKSTKLVVLGEWENRVDHVYTVNKDENTGDLLVHLVWKSGKDSIHPASVANKACPLKVIEFYEKRVKFCSGKSDTEEGGNSRNASEQDADSDGLDEGTN